MADNSNIIAVQQTLHGYDRGHHLLAGSLALTGLAARRLQIVTDLSGPTVVPGFESYLTGFPLDESFYAIARTWYADEMPRPGCVWTHTLLLRLGDVRQVHCLDALVRNFRRPILGESLDAYTRPIFLDPQSRAAVGVKIDDRVEAMLAALYSSADRTVLVPASAATDFDSVILALWRIHPVWLRRAFSFCTGALSLAAADPARDILVVPESLARRHRSDALIAVATGSEPYSWLRVITEQVAQLNPRPSLRFFASDVVRDRTSIRDVAEVIATVRSANLDSTGLASVLQVTSDRFPLPSEARQLKVAILDTKRHFLAGDAADRLQNLTERDTVFAAFAPPKTLIARLVQEAHTERPIILLSVAERLLRDRAAGPLLRTVLSAVNSSQLSTGSNDVLVEALCLSVKHSRSGELWRALGERGDVILKEATEQQRFPAHRWADVLTGLLKSGASVSVQNGILDLMPTAMIRDVLARTPLANASLRTRETLLAGLLVRPVVLSQMLASAAPGDWIELAVDFLYSRPTQLTHLVPSLCRLTAAATSETAKLHPFVALFGLREAGVEFVPCILRAAAILNQMLADEPTRRLQDLADRELPSIGGQHDWDLCERLSRAITNRFVDGSWSPELLFAEVDDSALFRSIVRVATYSKAGRRWLERVRQALLLRRLNARPWQRRIVLN